MEEWKLAKNLESVFLDYKDKLTVKLLFHQYEALLNAVGAI